MYCVGMQLTCDTRRVCEASKTGAAVRRLSGGSVGGRSGLGGPDDTSPARTDVPTDRNASSAISHVEEQITDAKTEEQQLMKEKEELMKEKEQLTAEKEQLTAEKEQLTAEKEQLMAKLEAKAAPTIKKFYMDQLTTLSNVFSSLWELIKSLPLQMLYSPQRLAQRADSRRLSPVSLTFSQAGLEHFQPRCAFGVLEYSDKQRAQF